MCVKPQIIEIIFIAKGILNPKIILENSMIKHLFKKSLILENILFNRKAYFFFSMTCSFTISHSSLLTNPDGKPQIYEYQRKYPEVNFKLPVVI